MALTKEQEINLIYQYTTNDFRQVKDGKKSILYFGEKTILTPIESLPKKVYTELLKNALKRSGNRKLQSGGVLIPEEQEAINESKITKLIESVVKKQLKQLKEEIEYKVDAKKGIILIPFENKNDLVQKSKKLKQIGIEQKGQSSYDFSIDLNDLVQYSLKNIL